jgi:hypothetical protein
MVGQSLKIPSNEIATSFLFILFSNPGSLNKFNQARDISSADNATDRIPSASTIARTADTKISISEGIKI